MTGHRWQPLTVREASGVFAGYGAPWWIAGGWAIDLFLGRQTRAHGDLDIAVLRGDQRALRTLLEEWEPHVAHGGELTPWDGEPLTAPHHQFWVRRPGADAWSFELLLEDALDGVWRFRRDARVTMPLTHVGHTTAEGARYLRPEIALLYKARPPHHELDRNAADFDRVVGALERDSRAWLRQALALAHPGHPWTSRLADVAPR